MTIPITGITPNFGLEYLVEGEPMFHTRAKLQRTMEAIDAALTAGPASPPGASDLLAVSGRVSTLEGRAPGAWTAATLLGSVTNLGTTGTGTYQSMRYRWLPHIGCVHIVGVTTAGTIAVGTNLFQLPVAMRPALSVVAKGQHATGSGQIDVRPDGFVQARFVPSSYLAINELVAL